MAKKKKESEMEETEEGKPAEASEAGGKGQPAEEEQPEQEAAEARISEHEKQPPGGRQEKKPQKKPSTRIVRMGGKDLDGDLPLYRALRSIRGSGFTLANAISMVSGLGSKKVGDLTDAEKSTVEDMLNHPGKHGIPSWSLNRRADPEDGTDRHMISGDLELRQKMDINELKKRKCYRGVRHIAGLPVRGQRTRGSFRKSATVGVSRAKQKPATSTKK